MNGNVIIRREGRAGLITLNRPSALNALDHDMCLAIEAAIESWRDDTTIDLVLIDASGEKAFCAGGDITLIYEQARAGALEPVRQFWRDEYRLNAKIAEYPKPIVSFLQGFVMGGGVGIGCHGSHRVVGASTQIAMPECGIGLIPDVGVSLILANAPGRLGEYLGLTGDRMNGADAIYAGFADIYIPEAEWARVREELAASGQIEFLGKAAITPEPSRLATYSQFVDGVFSGANLREITEGLREETGDFAARALAAISRGSPLALCCALEVIRQAREFRTVRQATALEYRFTWRSHEYGDFIEGIRAQVIDKDRKPHWSLSAIADVRTENVAFMLAYLGENELRIEGDA